MADFTDFRVYPAVIYGPKVKLDRMPMVHIYEKRLDFNWIFLSQTPVSEILADIRKKERTARAPAVRRTRLPDGGT